MITLPKKAMVAIDVDNLLISSAKAGQKVKGYSLITGFENFFQWISSFAEISSLYLYVSFSQCLKNEQFFQELREKYKDQFIFELVFCPRKREGKRKIDTVDEHLINHTKHLFEMGIRPEYFCLGSGDVDYSSFLWELKRRYETEIAFLIGSESSFSRVYRDSGALGTCPRTNEPLIHLFKPQKEERSLALGGS